MSSTAIGFDSDKYLSLQSKHIKERVSQFGKLYLEFGGKLFDDYHASRVLPGFAPDNKLKMLEQLKDQAEIVIVINASAIEQNKIRGDLGITYDVDVLRLKNALETRGFFVSSVVITQYTGQSAADKFRQKLATLGIRSYLHYIIDGYPENVSHILSDQGFGRNDYIETSRDLVVVTAPGPVPAAARWPPACPSSIMRTSGASRPDTPSSRPSPSGICPCAIPSISLTRRRQQTWTTST